MSNIVALFESVLNSYLQSFSPTVDQYFHDFDIQISSKKYSNEELDSLLEKVFILFPRSDKNYQNMIDKLASFTGTNSTFIIGHICSKLSTEINRKTDSLPTLQTYSLLTYRGTNFHHFMFVHYLILIFFSDLLLKIITKFPSAQFTTKIVKFGYGLCVQTSRLNHLHDLLIDTWSYIFYYISVNNIKCIIENFSTRFDQENPSKVIKLIHRISGNQAIADSILQSFIQAKKKKILTSELLLDLSFLLSRINCNIETLSEFYKITWELKSIDELKFGTIMMITVLFNRIPTQSKKVIQFYQTRVYKHTQNDKKVERSLRAFLHLIRGDISKVPGPGDNSNPLAYISTTRPLSISSQSSSPPSSSTQRQRLPNNSESYINTFMKVFFQKSNFSICPILFRDTLIQLASIDINEFTSLLLPKFLALSHTDSRFIIILTAIPFINQDDFINNNYCHASKQQIFIINQSVKKKLFDLIPVLQASTQDQRKTINFNSIQIQSIIDESDHLVNDFLQRNNFTLFDYNHDDRKLNKKNLLIKQNDLSITLNLLKCIKITFSNEDFIKNPELINIIIELSCSDDQLISETASSICINTFNKQDIQPLFIKEATKLILNAESFEVRSKSLQFLSYSLHNLTYELENEKRKENYYYDLEAASLIGLMSNSSYCRTLAFNLFKQIDSLKQNSEMILHHLVELNDPIIEKVKNFMTILNNPEKPFIFLPLIGHITFETACYCKYNDFWIINYAEVLNIIIDLKCDKVLEIINKSLQNRFNSIRKNAKQKSKKESKKDVKNKNKKIKENDKNETDFSLVSFFLCFIDTFASGKEFSGKSPESSWYIEKVDTICKKVLKCRSTRIKRSFVKSFRFLNWRVIPTVLHSTINIDTKLYSDISEALSLLIQNPTNSHKIFSQIFHVLIPYLNSFQTYFKDHQINGMSEIKWNDSLLKKLKKNEKICINYCILISVAFRKIQNTISENDWPLSYRQVHARFLSNWGQLPSDQDLDFNFDKLKAYSVDALILILKSGTIFTNDFEFDLSMLDMLSKSELSDYSVLDSLLFYHQDFLLGEFIKQVLLKTQRESLIFLNSIIHVLKKLDDSADIQQWGGALVLLAIYCNEQMNDDAWRFILQKIAILLLKEKNDSETVQMINKADNSSFVLTVFQFLTEQFIQFSLEVIKDSKRAVVVKMIVNFLNPWIEKLRILPTQGFIIPGIPTKYRIFSVLTFFSEILSLSQNLNDEQLDIFSQIWYNLLKSSDNNVIVLLLLFEYEKNDIKQKIFEKLLDKDPKMITKFLVKRCSFAFWYSIKTQRKINLNFQSWMMKVLSRSFINYRKEATKKFVLAFHFSLLFIEKAGDLFNALIDVLHLEKVDPSFVWKSDTDIENSMGVNSIISRSLNKIKETNPKAIEKWSLEATNWAVACNDLRIAHRSLVILNCLETNLDPNFTRLLSNAVLYFLNHSSILAQLTYITTATEPEPEPEPEQEPEQESENDIENDIENEINYVTFNLNLDENHQFDSSSYQSFNNNKSDNLCKNVSNEEEDLNYYSVNSNLSSSISIHVSSSEIDSNSQNDEISCYFSHNETISEENVIPSLDDVGLYVCECFKLLHHHFDEDEIGEFAFKFASCFIHFRPFLRNCLGNTLPIFMRFYYHSSFAEKVDINLIIDSFIPFSKSLETSRKSQELFADLIIKAKSPVLYIVASAFLVKNSSENQFLLSSLDIGLNYDEIIEMKFTQKEVQEGLTIFSEMIQNSSKKLLNSIFISTNDLILKYGKMIEKTPLVPIYQSALTLIAVFESASKLVQNISIIAPSIMSLKYNEWPPSPTSLDDLKSSISEIINEINENKKIIFKKKERNKIRATSLIPTANIKNNNNLRPSSVSKNEPIKLSSITRSQVSSSKIVFKLQSPKAVPLTRSSSKSSISRFSAGDAINFLDEDNNNNNNNDDDQDEIVPITKCKNISHLVGLIDQKHPPKIIPFASHFEMIIGLTKEVKKKMKMKEKAEKLLSKRKYTSSLSTASQMISHKSLAIDLAFQTGMAKLNLNRLKKAKILVDSKIDSPFENENNRDKFIVPFQDFLKLSEENSSEMSRSSLMLKRKKKKNF